MTIARVFPRRTSATPDDPLAFVGDPLLFLPAVDEVHISCLFTWDRLEAERLARAWSNVGYKVRVGGPAYDAPAGDFEPGLYVKRGFTITSRGCIRACPFCFVPRREGMLTLLPIRPGWDVLDNNLLACPRPHIEAVLGMLDDRRLKIPATWGGFVRAWNRPALIFATHATPRPDERGTTSLTAARGRNALAGDTPEPAAPGRVMEVG